ncbi:chaplin [Streptomyces sp. NPDC101118]|uniref:chaplin n=1 Tax=Streptomyces sp. NPDC101118 TaxID=3366109 RepID=UPI00381707BF
MKKTLIRTTTTAVAGAAVLMGGAGIAAAHGKDGSGASAAGYAAESPGVLSGNLVQVPVHVPVNLCGNTANLIALLNPSFGNTCINA